MEQSGRLENQRPVIRWAWAVNDLQADRFELGAAFWATVTGTRARRLSPGALDSPSAVLLPPVGDSCLKVRMVSGAGGAHLDLGVRSTTAAMRRALELGAVHVHTTSGRAVLRSPAGQLFCLVRWRGQTVRPAVVEYPDGASSRLDQVCIDVAAAAYDAEVRFWTALTGWPFHRGASPERDLIKPPSALPIRILIQRLGSARPASGHLDLACSDVEAVRAHHERHGARAIARWPHWTVMADPVGGSYCLTAREPHTGSLPGWAKAPARDELSPR